jgi:hypothetical protein
VLRKTWSISRKKKYTVSRLHNAGRQKSRRGEKLLRGRSRKIAGRQKQPREQAHEEEVGALDHEVLQHHPQEIMLVWEDRQDVVSVAATQHEVELAAA